MGQLRRHYDSLYPALLVLLGTPQRAELAKRALYVQAMRGDCFLGAKGLARKVGCSEKTWDRTLTWLREHKLARTWRLYRVNGQRSVNLLDLGRLWAVIRKMVSRLGLVERRGRRPWVKISGAWLSSVELLELRGETVASRAPARRPA